MIQTDQDLSEQRDAEQHLDNNQSNPQKGKMNLDQGTNTKESSQTMTIFKNRDQKPFQNFVIQKYESMSERDFKKVPISYIKQIYKKHSIDLRKLHDDAAKQKLNMAQSSIGFYSNQPQQQKFGQSNFSYRSIQNNSNQLQSSPQQKVYSQPSSIQGSPFGSQLRVNTVDIHQLDQSRKGFLSNTTSQSNSPINSFQNDSYITSRSMSSNYNFKITDIDVIKEDANSALQSPYIPKSNDNKVLCVSQSPPLSSNTSIKAWNQQANFTGNQISQGSPQTNRVLKKNFQELLVSPNKKEFGLKSLQQKLYQQSNQLPNIPQKQCLKVEVKKFYQGIQQSQTMSNNFTRTEKSESNSISNINLSATTISKQPKKGFIDEQQFSQIQVQQSDLQVQIAGVKNLLMKPNSSKNSTKSLTQFNQQNFQLSSKSQRDALEIDNLLSTKPHKVKKSINEEVLKNSTSQKYYFASEYKNNNQFQGDDIEQSLINNQRSKAQSVTQFSLSEIQKTINNQSAQNGQNNDEPQIRKEYFQDQSSQIYQFSQSSPFQNKPTTLANNPSTLPNQTEDSEHKLTKKPSTVIENFQKLCITQNSFLFRLDEEKEKLKNENIKIQQDKKSLNQNLFQRKSFRLSDINSNSSKIHQIEKVDNSRENQTPLNSKSSNKNQEPNITFNSQQEQNEEKELAQQESEHKGLKMLESKFVLHKPHNHTKNKAYIKNLQTIKSNPSSATGSVNGENSPISPSKKKLSLLQNSPPLIKEQKKSKDFTNLSPPGYSSPQLVKNKSQFSKIQGSLSKLENDETDMRVSRNLSSNIFKSPEKEMTASVKSKHDPEEIKTSIVKQILEEQTNMYHELFSSLEIKIFEKKRQEHQINIKSSSPHNENQLQINTSNPTGQESLQIFSTQQQKLSGFKKNIDCSPSAGRSRADSLNNPQNKSCNSPQLSKLLLEDPLMNRRSSRRNSQIENDQGSRSPLHIEGLKDIGKLNNETKHRSQFSNQFPGQFIAPASPSNKNNTELTKFSIEISNKNRGPESPRNYEKRNSKVYYDGDSQLQQLHEILQNSNINSSFSGQVHRQQTSMFSKMHTPAQNSKVLVLDSDSSLTKPKKNNIYKREVSNVSDGSIASDTSNQSNNSYTSLDPKGKNNNHSFNLASNNNNDSQKNEQDAKKVDEITPINKVQSPNSEQNSKTGNQNIGFSESIRSFYEKQNSMEERKSISSIKDTNNRGSMHMAVLQQQYVGLSPRQQSITKIQNQDQLPRKSGSFSRFQSFESRGSIYSPKNSQNTRTRLQASDQPSKQKGMATILIELNEIMEPSILKNLELSENLKTLLQQHKIKMDNLQNYYKVFLQFVLLEDSKVFNPDTFAGFKIHYTIFEQLQIILIESLKSLNYNTHAIEQIIERLEHQKKYITEGYLVNEIGGSSGILKMIVESMDELNLRLPASFTTSIQTEEKISILTRVINIICNSERQFNQHANHYINSIDQKSTFNIEIQPYLHHFKDFGQMEFYCLKLIFYTSLKQRGYRQVTIFRFLEQFEKARFKISKTLTMTNLLQDKELYEQLVQDYNWKVQHDTSLSTAFENNNEIIHFFIHSVILEFIYSLQGRFDLFFLLSKLPHLTGAHLNKLSNILVGIIEYRGLSLHIINDIKIKFLKIQYKLGLAKSPITLISQILNNSNFLENLIQEIDSIMRNDECFENFIKKFPEDKQSLTLGDNTQQQSGLRALSFFLLTLLSDYDVYSIQDLHSALQAFNVSITIPIQWKIAIDFALTNLKIPQNISSTIIEIISVQFSLLYKNTQYESFNEVLLN